MKSSNISHVFFTAILFCLLSSCSENPNAIETPPTNQIDRRLLEQTALQDGFIASELAPLHDRDSEPVDIGEHNYHKHSKPQQRIKLVRKMRQIGRTSEIQQVNDSTTVLTLQKKTSGEAIIAVVTATDSSKSWYVAKKPLEEIFTRKILFFNEHGDTDDDGENKDDDDTLDHHEKVHWKKFALSLMEGGTVEKSARITEVRMTLTDTTFLAVTSPLEFFLYWKKYRPLLPRCWKEMTVHIQVRVESTKPDPELVVVRRGSAEHGFVSTKQQLELITETNLEGIYQRVYGLTLSPHYRMGKFHSLVEVWTHESLYDSTAQISTHVWGMPYTVH